jgi:hypothetical protein
MTSIGPPIIESNNEGIRPNSNEKNKDGATKDRVSKKNSDNIKIFND